MPLSLTVSCFSKIQIGFTFLVPAHPAVICVCVCVCVRACVRACVCLLQREAVNIVDNILDLDALTDEQEQVLNSISVEYGMRGMDYSEYVTDSLVPCSSVDAYGCLVTQHYLPLVL